MRFFLRSPCAKRLTMTRTPSSEHAETGQPPGPVADPMRPAERWFGALRDEICAALEALEDALPPGAPLSESAPGRFMRTPWRRTDHSGAPGGGGLMSIMRGRVFEK